jgi:quinohemoprotein ethanol dehydrogenase
MKTGRPVENKAGADYGDGKPKLVFPSPIGAHNWNPMSYSPRTGLVYIPTVHMGALYAEPRGKPQWLPGRMNTNVQVGFSFQLADQASLPPDLRPLADPEFLATQPDVAPSAALRAWDPVKREFVWSFPNSSFMDHGGVLSTGGGLVVQGGLDGILRVFRDSDGTQLKQVNVGTAMIAAPMTYSVDGVQYIAILAGSGGGGWSSWLPQNIAYTKGNANRILAFRLDGGPTPVPEDLPPPGPIPEPPQQVGTPADIAAGAVVFAANCTSCHTNTWPAPIPDLRRTSAATHAAFKQIVLQGALQARGMPRFDDVLGEKEVGQVQAYLLSLAHAAYAAEQGNPAGKPVQTQPALQEGHL